MKIADIPPVSYMKGELSMITFIRGGEGWNFHQGPTIYEYPDGLVFMCWGREKVLADEVGLNQLSNFSVVQLKDGRILLCTSHYTAQPPNCSDLYLAVFDEQWVAAGT